MHKLSRKDDLRGKGTPVRLRTFGKSERDEQPLHRMRGEEFVGMAQILDDKNNLLLDEEGLQRFDAELSGLLRQLLSSSSHVACSATVEKLLDSMQGKLIEPVKEDGWGDKRGWREEWPRFRRIRKEWSSAGGPLNERPMRRALEAALNEMTRFVVDATTDHFQRKYRSQLVEAIKDYLSLRGLSLPEPSAGPPKKRRGRPPMQDAENDKRLFDLWKSGKYKTFEQMALALRMDQDVLEQAIERERKRRQRKTKSKPCRTKSSP